MLKPLTLTFSLAIALVLAGVSQANDLCQGAAPSEQSAVAPAPMVGDEAPPAPEVPHGPTSSLLFSTPSGN